MIGEVLQALGIEYAAAGPADDALSRRTREGILPPVLLECRHEEFAVAMAHGYAKIAGKPMAALLDGESAVKRAAMAIFNAFADRVPVLAFVAKGDSTDTRDPVASMREFIKWVGEAGAPQTFPAVAARAYQAALTPPMGPAAIIFDPCIADSSLPPASLPRVPAVYPPRGDRGAVAEAAQLLAGAERPLICAERAARTPEGPGLIVELAELLGAPVRSWERMNFPNRHPLAGSGWSGYEPDFLLALDVRDVDALARRSGGCRVVHITPLLLEANRNYQTHGAYADKVAIDISGDVEATLPGLTEECRQRMTPAARSAAAERSRRFAEVHREAWQAHWEAARRGRNASPVTVPRLCAELWPLIEHEDWSLVSWAGFLSDWPLRLWNFDRHYRYIGGQGAGGLGYGAPAAAGAALANQPHGRLSINIQSDGDLMYGPAILSTLARLRIPLLTVMHNNRSYQAEVAGLRLQASLMNRDPDRAETGTALDDPAIDFAALARSMGIYAEGPLSDPAQLHSALLRGLERVKAGEPVLIDVLTQLR
jgi:acetolactate synthase I/II/III large subunit